MCPKVLHLTNEALIKQKIIRVNDTPFRNRKLKNSLMVRPRLKITFLKHPTNEKKKIKEAKKFLCQYIKEREKNYFENLDTKKISDNKTFWKTVKPLLCNKLDFQ